MNPVFGMRLVGVALVLMVCPWARGETIPQAYVQVAGRHGIPPEVLYAVALTESALVLTTGRQRPWPWTLNVHGRGERYRTRLEAWEAIQRHLEAGRTSIDIGLMQVNWRWHRNPLGNPWRALDPYHNLQVGASLLRERFQESGDWSVAVGRYHAPSNPRYAQRYRTRVQRQLERLGYVLATNTRKAP